MKTGKYLTLFGKGNIDGLAMFWDTTDLCTKLLNAEWEVNQQEGEKFKCYMILQMMVALLRSNGQLRTDRDGDTEKGCEKPAVQQKTTDDEYNRPQTSPWTSSVPLCILPVVHWLCAAERPALVYNPPPNVCPLQQPHKVQQNLLPHRTHHPVRAPGLKEQIHSVCWPNVVKGD